MIPFKRLASGPSRRSRLTAGLVALVLTGTALSACGSPVVVSGGLIRAVGAENEYANVITQIGGRYVSVSAVMSNPNTDPHSFEVSTSVARSIASAQLIVQNGVGYDTFMNQLESASPSSSRHVIEVQTLEGLPSDTKNPHLWYQPSTMPRVAKVVAADLSKLQSRHASYFAARLASFNMSMARVDRAIAAFRRTFKGVKVATTEPVADYLLSALGLDDVTPFRFQADVMNGIDPSPEDIAFQQNLFKDHKVKVFCYNAQVNSTVTESLRSLAQSSHVAVVAVYETMPTPNYDYQTWMLAEIAALTKALTTSTSTTSLLGGSS
jgi:zinc/manganese transport system substrate-binding protein